MTETTPAPRASDAVRVKELDWVPQHETYFHWLEALPFGPYRIYDKVSPIELIMPGSATTKVDTIEAAKAVAQADFNARILSALEPASSGGVAEAVDDIREECAKIAEGPLYKTHYRGSEDHNWSAGRHHSNQYGLGRMEAADAIRASSTEAVEPVGFMYRQTGTEERWQFTLGEWPAHWGKQGTTFETRPLYTRPVAAQQEGWVPTTEKAMYRIAFGSLTVDECRDTARKALAAAKLGRP